MKTSIIVAAFGALSLMTIGCKDKGETTQPDAADAAANDAAVDAAEADVAAEEAAESAEEAEEAAEEAEESAEEAEEAAE
ncbi:MAG: hypothetical protein R3A79_14940 [Nannocystaceae bacterium]